MLKPGRAPGSDILCRADESRVEALPTFTFNAASIRVITIDGAPWFVAADVRRILALTRAGTNFIHLNDDEMSLCGRATLGLPPGRPMVLLSESGLYKLIMRSDKPEARAFQDWVTKVVLPAIRKDGAYVMGEEASQGPPGVHWIASEGVSASCLPETAQRPSVDSYGASGAPRFHASIRKVVPRSEPMGRPYPSCTLQTAPNPPNNVLETTPLVGVLSASPFLGNYMRGQAIAYRRLPPPLHLRDHPRRGLHPSSAHRASRPHPP